MTVNFLVCPCSSWFECTLGWLLTQMKSKKLFASTSTIPVTFNCLFYKYYQKSGEAFVSELAQARGIPCSIVSCLTKLQEEVFSTGEVWAIWTLSSWRKGSGTTFLHGFSLKIRQLSINTRIYCIQGFRQKLLKECNKAEFTGVVPVLKCQLLKLHQILAQASSVWKVITPLY